MLQVDQLPNDPTLLKRVLIEQLAERDVLIERIREEAAEQMESLRQRLEAEHKAAMDAILRRYYGPRSERFDPAQLLLFGLEVEAMPIDEQSVEEEAGEKLVTRRVAKRHKHGRKPLPEKLPRIEIVHDLQENEKPCPCCGEVRHRIGEDVSEQLEYMPASFKVLKHVRVKYACGHCEQEGYNPQIVAAAKPKQPIEKGLPGPGLLAYVIVSKLGDHLPLYRLERIFQRQQLSIARSTMAAWLQAAAELVRPLVERMGNRVQASKVVHTDDTRVPIQSPGEGKCRNGHIWAYIGDGLNPYVVYDYTADRTRAGPTNWLRTYRGFLQADAYGGYDGIYHGGGVTEVACWAHARRKFFDAKATDGKRATQMLSMVRELYAIEEKAKELDDDKRRELRQAQSVPVLARIKTWLDAERLIVLPRSEMGKAFTYALNQWDALCAYTTQGFLAIDNNAAERAMKRVALGRKNWLFAGNDAAGKTAAMLYSLIATAERHGIDPQRYLTSVLAKLPFTPAGELDQFLADVWKKDSQEPRHAANAPTQAPSTAEPSRPTDTNHATL
jgi:transposase